MNKRDQTTRGIAELVDLVEDERGFQRHIIAWTVGHEETHWGPYFMRFRAFSVEKRPIPIGEADPDATAPGSRKTRPLSS